MGSPKHRYHWNATLANYAIPVIGDAPVGAIDTALVMKVLEPLWRRKPETASRLRGRIERILDYAKVCGYRDGENPARWSGHLSEALPKISKVKTVTGHAAMAYGEMPAFMQELRAREDVPARALEFVVLTACRTGDILGQRGRTDRAPMLWDHVSRTDRVWTIPKTKNGSTLRVPLSSRAMEILRGLPRDGDLVFPGLKDRTMRDLLQQMRPGVVVHGLRATFSSWTAACTNFPREVCETALAHAIKNKTEAAYQRDDLLEKRRLLMDAWARYCGPTPVASGDVIAMRR
jgi:integrase